MSAKIHIIWKITQEICIFLYLNSNFSDTTFYTVQKGDTLRSVAEKVFGSSEDYKKLIERYDKKVEETFKKNNELLEERRKILNEEKELEDEHKIKLE